MDKNIAFCGIICSECPIYIATQKNDEAEKAALASKWRSETYQIQPEEIYCLGCGNLTGEVYKYCKECPIRLCGIQKGYETCAPCDEYPCAKLAPRFEKSPQYKKVLDEIRLSRGGQR